jgi:hypothetical protein
MASAGSLRTLDDLLRVLVLGLTRTGAPATREILDAASAAPPIFCT